MPKSGGDDVRGIRNRMTRESSQPIPYSQVPDEDTEKVISPDVPPDGVRREPLRERHFEGHLPGRPIPDLRPVRSTSNRSTENPNRSLEKYSDERTGPRSPKTPPSFEEAEWWLLPPYLVKNKPIFRGMAKRSADRRHHHHHHPRHNHHPRGE